MGRQRPGKMPDFRTDKWKNVSFLDNLDRSLVLSMLLFPGGFMKRFALLGLIVLTAACSPKMRTAPELKAPEGEAIVKRGEYLANHVAACVGCHSERDASQPGAPALAAHAFAGGALLTEKSVLFNGEGFPGTAQAKNLTQDSEHGLGAWTDGEIARAIREGVDKNGEPLFPMMPYTNYKYMADQDVLAIIAYLRTIQPVARPDRAADLDFPLSLIVNFIPEPLAGPVAAPATDTVARGAYLTRIASCNDCHTPSVRGEPVEGEAWSGGVVINEHGMGTVVSSNLTPDAETGLGNVTAEQWLAMFREGKGKDGRPLNATMPWAFYRGMTDEDLLAIYAYFRTVPPIKKDTMAVLAEYSRKD